MARAKVTRRQLRTITDPREMPAYSLGEAACILQLPLATLKSWVQGRYYSVRAGRRLFKPVIELPDPDVPLLSFYNLAEAHVLSGFRRKHHLKLQQIRSALDYVRRRFGWRHPLIQQRFETDGAALFIERLGVVVDASAGGQIVMQTVRAHFRRFDYADDLVVRFWPFTRHAGEDSPRSVFIDPRVSFGRPSLARSKVPTAVIAQRYKAGESIADLADDYGCERLEIEEALRCELAVALAA